MILWTGGPRYAKALSRIQEYGLSYFSQVIPWILRREVVKDKALFFLI